MNLNDYPVQCGETVYSEAFAAGIKPDAKLDVAQWSAENRHLHSNYAGEPGPWRNERVPYLVEPMQRMSPSDPCDEFCVMKGSQLGFTEVGINFCLYVIDRAPGPLLFVKPTQELAKLDSKQRLQPAIEDCQPIKGKIADNKTREAGNNTLLKEFEGGLIRLAGANSAASLRQMPAKYLILDELDAYPDDVDGEGDPAELAVKRTTNFRRRKIIKISTPGIAGRSKIAAEFENSDKRYYFVPCPHCGHIQVIDWKRIRWDKGAEGKPQLLCGGVFPERGLEFGIEKTEPCGALIDEYHKTKMLAGGRWIPKAYSINYGYHISGLYSPLGWYSWVNAVADFLKAHRTKNAQKMKVFVNTVLGETYTERGDAPDWELIAAKKENYKIGTAPQQVVFLTAGVDIQADRIEVETVGWSEDRSSWSCEYSVLLGDTDKQPVWDQLAVLVDRPLKHASGLPLKIKAMAVDSGYNTQQVYSFCRLYQPDHVMAVKGDEGLMQPAGVPKKIDMRRNGKQIKRGVHLRRVGVSMLKQQLYGQLRKTKNDDGTYPPAYTHFPEYEDEFFKQITAEDLIKEQKKYGGVKFVWSKTRERNEALDCRVYGMAAASTCGLETMGPLEWEMLRAGMGTDDESAPKPMKRKPASSHWKGREL